MTPLEYRATLPIGSVYVSFNPKRGGNVYTVIDFSARGHGGRPDKIRRHYGAVLVGGPEDVREQKWLIKLHPSFRRAAMIIREAYQDRERFPAAFVVTKQPNGELHPSLVKLRELTGWADDDGWNCWAGAVLADALWTLENDGNTRLDSGCQWVAYYNPESPGYPIVTRTDPRAGKWPWCHVIDPGDRRG